MWVTALIFYLGIFGVFSIPITKTEPESKTDIKYRLPGDIEPSNYVIKLNVTESFVSKDHHFDGEVIITAKTKKQIATIRLHANAMQIENEDVSVDVAGKDIHSTIDYSNMEKYNFLDLNLASKINADTVVKITIKYIGKLGNDMRGFYLSDYIDKDGKPQLLATTQFQPTHARSAFPCFDEPQYKATFKISITKPEDYDVVISNMPEQKTEDDTVEFKVTPIMSTYLVAFIVSKFTYTEGHDKNFKVWARPEAEPQMNYTAEIGMDIVNDLNKFTNINYFDKMKIGKLDMAALPDFSAGAMENWGLLTYRETALLVDYKLSTNRDIQRVASVVAHEMAHQWFGDYVTLKWWENTWLNEGFARYFEYHTTGSVIPEWEMANQFVVEQQQNVFGIDALVKTTPLNNPVNSPEEISSHFGTISYGKGGSVIRMMSYFLGKETFQKGLSRYLNTHQFENTVPKDLFTSLEEQVKEDKLSLDYSVEKIMTTWVDQPGYPVVTVSANDDGFVNVTQERFFINSEDKNIKEKLKWYVPVSYATSLKKDFETTSPKLWLTPNEPSKIIRPGQFEWLIFNVQETGYYRVNYDKTLWEQLTKVLNSDERKNIHKLNRAQIVDDVMNLARAGFVTYEIALGIMDYMATEDDYYPWYSAFETFRYLLQRYDENDDTGKELRDYIISLMDKLLTNKDFTEDPKEKQIDVFNKVNALEWACNLDKPSCVDSAKKIFETKKTDVPKNLKSVIYCTALRNGAKDAWNILWNRYKISNVAAEKVTILKALGCSKDEKQLKAYLELSLTEVRKQDANYVFSAVYTGNSKGVDIAFNFLKENYLKIANSYGGMNALGNAMIGLAGRLNTETQITEFRKFLKEHGDKLADAKEVADAAIEKAEENIKWSKKYDEIITQYIKKKKTGKPDSATNLSLSIFLMILSLYISIFG